MRKPAFCISKYKGPDQLHDSRAAEQRLFFYFINPKFQASSNFCGCTARFEPDRFGNPKDRYSRYAAHFSSFKLTCRHLYNPRCCLGPAEEEAVG